MLGFSDLVQRLREDERPNHIEKAAVLKITSFVWTGPMARALSIQIAFKKLERRRLPW